MNEPLENQMILGDYYADQINEIDRLQVIFCPACNDTPVSVEIEVCEICQTSLVEDWLCKDDYNNMRQMAVNWEYLTWIRELQP